LKNGVKMNRLKITSYSLLIISVVLIMYALIFSPADWIVYGIAIVFIPIFILSLGLITMAKPNKDEEEERIEEPFIGY
jgi:energy-converting hydrogenase A subunit I